MVNAPHLDVHPFEFFVGDARRLLTGRTGNQGPRRYRYRGSWILFRDFGYLGRSHDTRSRHWLLFRRFSGHVLATPRSPAQGAHN